MVGNRQQRSLRRRVARGVVCLGGLLAVGAIALGVIHQQAAAALTIPSPAYSIETWSGTTHTQLVGALGVLLPVDVDRDLVPDVDVLVNALSLSQLSQGIAPTISINRDPVDVALGKTPPVKLVATFTLVDSSSAAVTDHPSFGYDATGPGASTPDHFVATLGGLTSGFNPLTATIDTIGGISGLNLGLGQPTPTYQGPLTLLAHTSPVSGTGLDLSFGYQHFPGKVGVQYSTDATGSHIQYDQTAGISTQLQTRLALHYPDGSSTTVTGSADPLPTSFHTDLQTTDTSGTIHVTQTPTTRNPDIAFNVVLAPAAGPSSVVNGNLVGVPSSVSGTWSTVPGQPAASFDAAAGLPSVDLTYHDFPGAPTVLPAFQPSQQQFVSYQSLPTPGGGDETAIAAHAADLRHLDFAVTPIGFVTHTDMGDGTQPLEVNYLKDGRNGTDGHLLRAHATVSPLPSKVALTLSSPGPDLPVEVVSNHNATGNVTITGHAQDTPDGGTDVCSGALTLCADFAVDHVPATLELRTGNLDTYGRGADVDNTPVAGQPAPNVTADITLGPGVLTAPVNATTAIVGHLNLTGIPAHVRSRIHSDASAAVDAVEFHGCSWSFTANPPSCSGNAPLDPIGSVTFDTHNFPDNARPASMPAPVSTTAQHLNVVARHATDAATPLFEAEGAVNAVRDLNLHQLNLDAGGIIGFAAQIGDDTKLATHLDLDAPSRTLAGDVTFDPLPANASFCVREAETPLGATTGSLLTAKCETTNVFGESPAPTVAPITAVFGANATFALNAAVTSKDKAADKTYDVHVATATVPTSLVANVRLQDPSCTASCLPLRATYSLPSSAPVSVDVAAKILTGDAICADPRDGAAATCVSATLKNLPTSAALCYEQTTTGACDPHDPDHNLSLATGAPAGPSAPEFQVTNLVLSEVKPAEDASSSPTIVRASGQLLGIPRSIVGSVGGDTFELQTPGGAIRRVDVELDNFVGPAVPSTVTIPPSPTIGPAPASTVAAIIRGTALQVRANVDAVTNVGYRPAVDASTGAELKDRILTAGFGAGEVVRTYADVIDPFGDQTLVDAIIEQNPGSMSLCFRGADPDAAKAAHPVWCDDQAGDPAHSGALQFRQSIPADSVYPTIDAYFRTMGRSSGRVFSGTVRAQNVPAVVQATFGTAGNKAYEVSVLDADGNPAGIGVLTVDLASFDLPAAQRPYPVGSAPDLEYPHVVHDPVFPPTAPISGQYVNVAANDDGFELIGSIGGIGDNLDHLLFTDKACAKPDGNRDDYPHLPDTAGYTCVRADFVQTPFLFSPPFISLGADLTTGDQRLTLTHGGISVVPAWFQVTLANAATLQDDTSFRSRCGAADGPLPDSRSDCMPPLIRFDQSQTSGSQYQPMLYGILTTAAADVFGSETAKLAATQPDFAFLDQLNQIQDLNADPSAGWFGDAGARIQLGKFTSSTVPSASATAVIANLRVPLAGSLTVDQIQQYTDPGTNAPITGPYSMGDIKAHLIARDYPAAHPHGITAGLLGNLEAMVAKFTDGAPTPGQILVHNDTTTGIPGEVGIDFYQRSASFYGGQVFVEGPDPTNTVYQVDARLSSPLSLSVRLTHLSSALNQALATINHIPPLADGAPPDYVCNVSGGCDPSARIRLETIDGDGVTIGSGHFQGCREGGSCPVGAVGSYVHIDHVDICLDMHVGLAGGCVATALGSLPAAVARRVDVVVHTNTETTGVQVDGFASVDPNDTTPAVVKGGGDVDIDHLDLTDDTTDINLGTIGSFFYPGTNQTHLWMYLKLNLELAFEASHFVMRQDGFHFNVTSTGGQAVLGPITMYDDPDHAVGFEVPSEDVHGNQSVVLEMTSEPNEAFAAFYFPSGSIPEGGVPWDLGFNSCSYSYTDDGWWEANDPPAVAPTDIDFANTVDIDNTTVDFVANPFWETRKGYFLEFPASVQDLGDYYNLISEGLCSTDGPTNVDVPPPYSTTGPIVDLGEMGYPSDPLAYPEHPVPGMHLNSPVVGGTIGPDAPLHPTPPPIIFDPGSPPPPDTIGPVTQLVTIPAPDATSVGGNPTYLARPSAIVLAADEPGGSGIQDIWYRVGAGAFQKDDDGAPFTIPAGTPTVCSYAVDVAGNEGPHTCQQLTVDDAIPIVQPNGPAPSATGWFVSVPSVTLTATDPDNSNATHGTGLLSVSTSLDGAPLVTTAGAQTLSIPAGEHVLRYFATDAVGHRSVVAEVMYRVQTSKPVAVARLWPPQPASAGWWRTTPLVFLTAADGPHTAGVSALQYRFDGGTFQTYTGPFTVPSGVHTVDYQALDASGPQNNGPIQSMVVPVDVTPPTAIATSPNPTVLIGILGGSVKLGWKVGDDLSSSVHVQVLVFNVAGQVVRSLDGGTVAVTPGQTVTGTTTWDGHEGLLGGLLTIGVYSYRVVVTDQAGNVAQSGQSVPIQVSLRLL
jgi:hypothetical protein